MSMPAAHTKCGEETLQTGAMAGCIKLLERLHEHHADRTPGGARYPDIAPEWMLWMRKMRKPMIDPIVVDPLAVVEPPPVDPEPELEPPPPPPPPPPPEDWQPTIGQIQRAVVHHFGITMMVLLSQRRTANVVRPRHIAMYLAAEMTTHSCVRIGRFFGDRDHTTVMHACRAIESLIPRDAQLAADVEAVRRLVVAADSRLGRAEP